jgi:hypothetical protein
MVHCALLFRNGTRRGGWRGKRERERNEGERNDNFVYLLRRFALSLLWHDFFCIKSGSAWWCFDRRYPHHHFLSSVCCLLLVTVSQNSLSLLLDSIHTRNHPVCREGQAGLPHILVLLLPARTPMRTQAPSSCSRKDEEGAIISAFRFLHGSSSWFLASTMLMHSIAVRIAAAAMTSTRSSYAAAIAPAMILDRLPPMVWEECSHERRWEQIRIRQGWNYA